LETEFHYEKHVAIIARDEDTDVSVQTQFHDNPQFATVARNSCYPLSNY